MFRRLLPTTALSAFFILSLTGGACLSQMDEIPRWLILVYGVCLPVQAWIYLDMLYDVWKPDPTLLPPKEPIHVRHYRSPNANPSRN